MKNKTDNKNKDYYKNATDWYFDIFSTPLSERNALILITLLASVVFLSMVYAAYYFFPLVPEKPYRIVIEDALGKIPSVKQLTKGSKKNVAVARFLLKEYTKSRENYDIDKIQRNFGMVKQFSNKDVLREFQKNMSVSNPDSPIMKYERHTKRKISVTSSSVIPTDNWLNNKAIVRFKAFEHKGSEQKSSSWEAYITFNFGKISVSQDTGELSPLNFEVVNYKVKKLIK